jgi:hypothetical protein
VLAPLSLLRALIPAGAATTVLLLGSPAVAATTLPLHSAHRNTTAAGFSSHSCDQVPKENQGPGLDGFVFVLPSNDANFVSLTLTFKNTSGSSVTIKVPDASDSYPDGITTNGTSKAYVVVPAGWTLVDGVATVDNDGTKADDFNLTHTCVGAGSTPSPSAPPSTSPSPSISVSPSKSAPPSSSSSPAVSVSPSTGSGGGSLPLTGVAIGGMTLTGAALVAGGAALLMVRRRRDVVFAADAPGDVTDGKPADED